jgi:site-specific recombinase XerC
VVPVDLKGWFTTYKTLKDGTRKLYHYHRATLTRLHGEPGSPEFIADFADAEAMLKARHSGDTFNGLIRAFTGSVEFEKKLSASSQREYKRMLTKAEPEFGDMPRAALNDPKVKAVFLDWRAKVARSSGEREADNRLSIISAMLTWAVEDARLLDANHLKGFRRLYHADRSEIIWLPEHIEAFMKAPPLEIQRALILALHSGQREGDLLRLPWSAYDGACIRLRQGKARRSGRVAPLIEVPCTKALRHMLDQMERASKLILTTRTGQPFKKRYFARLWEKASKEAGLNRIYLPGLEEPVQLHFHDLRGTAVTLLSEADCSVPQIAAITGHSLKTVHQILERYLARTRGLADQAISNWENSPRTEFANRLQTTTPEQSTPKGKRHVSQ